MAETGLGADQGRQRVVVDGRQCSAGGASRTSTRFHAGEAALRAPRRPPPKTAASADRATDPEVGPGAPQGHGQVASRFERTCCPIAGRQMAIDQSMSREWIPRPARRVESCQTAAKTRLEVSPRGATVAAVTLCHLVNILSHLVPHPVAQFRAAASLLERHVRFCLCWHFSRMWERHGSMAISRRPFRHAR